MRSMLPSLQIMLRIVNFFNCGIKSSSLFASFFFKNCLIERESNMFFNLKYICRKISCNLNDLLEWSKSSLKNSVVNKLHPQVDLWKIHIVNELLYNRDVGNTYINIDNQILKDILNFICIN